MLTVRDETTFAFSMEEHVFRLDFPTKWVTLRELIRGRVCGEARKYNARRDAHFHGLVLPPDAKRGLNSSREMK